MYTIKATYSSPNHSHEIKSTGENSSLDQLTTAITAMKTDLNQYLTKVMVENNESLEAPQNDDDDEEEEEEDEDEKEESTDPSLDQQSKKQKTSP
ncbi:hypothetical protein [Absidia glauca]|uniref:Uncharacterized protein n=1 Tax=Absidia glauca TaxID=4829 RepID=A0A168LST0_ABSGL|nr:hypothetical protein [Absidia glauca]